MNYELVSLIGDCIDNVYNNTSEQADRRTVARLGDDLLTIEFRTILTIAKDQDLKFQLDHLKSESTQLINSRLKTIKSIFKDRAGRALSTKKCHEEDSMETLTVSPYSPIKTIKYVFKVSYEIA